MQFQSKRSISVMIELNEQEAEYLKGLTQNCLEPGGFEKENPRAQRIRQNIFEGLRDALEEAKS